MLECYCVAGRASFRALGMLVLGSVSELERGLISERCRAGIRNARAKGKRIGRPPLRKFSQEEVKQIRVARQKDRASIRQLAIRNGTTHYIINRILATEYAGA
jgi:DNA invertase Pin-like site-specific DNA recombinase